MRSFVLLSILSTAALAQPFSFVSGSEILSEIESFAGGFPTSFDFNGPDCTETYGEETETETYASATETYVSASSTASANATANATQLTKTVQYTLTTQLPSTFITKTQASSSVATTSAEFVSASTASIPATSTSSTAASTASGSYEYTGRGTFYTPSADACGTTSTSEDLVVAIAQTLYDSGSYCGKYINAEYQGKTVQVRVVDACESCTNVDLDFSPTAFAKMADLDVGVIQVSWSWA